MELVWINMDPTVQRTRTHMRTCTHVSSLILGARNIHGSRVLGSNSPMAPHPYYAQMVTLIS